MCVEFAENIEEKIKFIPEAICTQPSARYIATYHLCLQVCLSKESIASMSGLFSANTANCDGILDAKLARVLSENPDVESFLSSHVLTISMFHPALGTAAESACASALTIFYQIFSFVSFHFEQPPK